MLKKILLGLVAIIAIIVIISRFQPDTYTVERTGTVAAPPSVVFAQITDFHNWEKFNPWRDLDTNMVMSYSGEERGVGAKYHWAGNSDAGKGDMTIVEARPDEYIKVDLHFIEPFEGNAINEFRLAQVGTDTKLTQSMTGEHNFFSKIMCVFTSMDKMIGPMYEEGFKRMNTVMRGMQVEPVGDDKEQTESGS